MRPRLVERLRGRFRAPVTLLVAPAGLGKTTLLAQAAADNPLAPLGTDCLLACTAADAAAGSALDRYHRALDELHLDPGDVARRVERLRCLPP